MKLQRRSPWQQLCPLGLFNLLIGMEHAGRALHDDAPAFGSIVVVGLEKNTIVYCGADQFGALRGAKEHGAALDDEVDWKDLGLALAARDRRPNATLASRSQLSLTERMVTGSPVMSPRGAARNTWPPRPGRSVVTWLTL
jgi:hypothetical protein